MSGVMNGIDVDALMEGLNVGADGTVGAGGNEAAAAGLNLGAPAGGMPVKVATLGNGGGISGATVYGSQAWQGERRTQDVMRPELRKLMVNYCATYREAIELSEMKWQNLAVALGVRVETLEATAAEMEAKSEGGFWMEVLTERIKRVGAMATFRNVSWERLESQTLAMLVNMAERGLIRDAGELLAIASAARRVNEPQGHGGSGNTNVMVNIGDGAMTRDGVLPGGGAQIAIDLSPRLAQKLAIPREERTGPRVIDGEMLNAKELREALIMNQKPPVDSAEGE